MHICTSESDAAVFGFDERQCKQFGTPALQNPTKEAYDLSALSFILSLSLSVSLYFYLLYGKYDTSTEFLEKVQGMHSS